MVDVEKDKVHVVGRDGLVSARSGLNHTQLGRAGLA